MGNTCKPLAVSFQCMTKSTTNKKKKKEKRKINRAMEQRLLMDGRYSRMNREGLVERVGLEVSA